MKRKSYAARDKKQKETRRLNELLKFHVRWFKTCLRKPKEDKGYPRCIRKLGRPLYAKWGFGSLR